MNNYKSVLQAITAALLFGASAPISKLLLGSIDPVPLAAFLYIGSGIGLIIFKIINYYLKSSSENNS